MSPDLEVKVMLSRTQLPVELLHVILLERDSPSVSSYSLVSHELLELSRPYLFHHISGPRFYTLGGDEYIPPRASFRSDWFALDSALATRCDEGVQTVKLYGACLPNIPKAEREY